MCEVLPFRALRPRSDLASKVAAPPYDVVSVEEARSIADGNPLCFLRIDRSEIELDDGVDPYSPAVYERARRNLTRLMETGTLVRDPRPSFYVYRLTREGRPQTGLVALCPVAEYLRGTIKKHEHTRPSKVEDRARHIMTTRAQVSPVFSAYRWRSDVQEISDAVSRTAAATDFVDADRVRHELWVVDDEGRVQAFRRAFAGIETLYIADGHHRSEAAAEVARRAPSDPEAKAIAPRCGHFLNVIFADRDLTVLPYNRVVRDLGGRPLQVLLDQASSRFEIRKAEGAVAPDRSSEFGLYVRGEWYRLVARPGSFDPGDPVGSIPAAILGNGFLGPILGIDDPRTDPRVDFVGGIRGTRELERLVNTEGWAMALSLPPTGIDQLLRVADSGQVMPPKSTWFEPKLRSGVIVNLLTE